MIQVPIKFQFFNYTGREYEYKTPFVLSTTVGKLLETSLNGRFSRHEVKLNAYEVLTNSIDNDKWVNVPFDEKEIYRGALGLAMGKHIVIAIKAYANDKWVLSMHGIELYHTNGTLPAIILAKGGIKFSTAMMDSLDAFDTVAQIISTYNNKGDTMHTHETGEAYPGLAHVKRHEVRPKVRATEEEVLSTEERKVADSAEAVGESDEIEVATYTAKCVPLYRAAALAVSRMDVRRIVDYLYSEDTTTPSADERECMITMLTDNLMEQVMLFCDEVNAQVTVGGRAITGKVFTIFLAEKQATFVCFLEPGPKFSIFFAPIGYTMDLAKN